MNIPVSPTAGFGLQPDDLTEEDRSPRVLVVDDVADNRDILSRRLSRRGYEVVEAPGPGVLRVDR